MSPTRCSTFLPDALDALPFYQTLWTQHKFYRTLQTQGQAYSRLGRLGRRGGNRMQYRTSGDMDFFPDAAPAAAVAVAVAKAARADADAS
jgi:predicted DNA-binding WGR domain protein